MVAPKPKFVLLLRQVLQGLPPAIFVTRPNGKQTRAVTQLAAKSFADGSRDIEQLVNESGVGGDYGRPWSSLFITSRSSSRTGFLTVAKPVRSSLTSPSCRQRSQG